MPHTHVSDLILQHEARLWSTYHDEFLPAVVVSRELGFTKRRAFYLAARCGYLPFETFTLPGKRGLFARLHDVAVWRAAAQTIAITQETTLMT